MKDKLEYYRKLLKNTDKITDNKKEAFYAEEIVKILKKRGNPDEIELAKLYLTIAGGYSSMWDSATADYYYHEALDIFSKHGNKYNRQLLFIYLGLGMLYSYDNEYDLALSNYELAKQISDKMEDKSAAYIIKFGIEGINRKKGNINNEKTIMRKEYKEVKEDKEDKEYRNIFLKSENLYDSGKYKAAINPLLKLIEKNVKDLGERHSFNAESYKRLLHCYTETEEYDKVIEYGEKYLKIIREEPEWFIKEIANICAQLSMAYTAKGKFRTAEKFAREAFEIAVEVEDDSSIKTFGELLRTIFSAMDRYGSDLPGLDFKVKNFPFPE